jgi:hypothetical protein
MLEEIFKHVITQREADTHLVRLPITEISAEEFYVDWSSTHSKLRSFYKIIGQELRNILFDEKIIISQKDTDAPLSEKIATKQDDGRMKSVGQI